MRGLGILYGVVLLLPLAGCGSSDDGTEPLVKSYRSALRREQNNQQKLLRILESVKDFGSMPEALTRLRKEYDEAAKRPDRLEPPPPEVKERLRPEFESLGEGIEQIRGQIRRILKLPGGEAFLAEFEKLKKEGPTGP